MIKIQGILPIIWLMELNGKSVERGVYNNIVKVTILKKYGT
jgi:hypothetical protein